MLSKSDQIHLDEKYIIREHQIYLILEFGYYYLKNKSERDSIYTVSLQDGATKDSRNWKQNSSEEQINLLMTYYSWQVWKTQ